MQESTFTDQLSAWSTFAAAAFSFVVLVIALLTWRTARSALRASQEANEQARRDSIEQTRPYVFAEIVPSLAGHPNWDIRITNAGKSAARGLTLNFSNWPDEPDDIADSVRRLFQTSRTLPPGSSIRAMWRLQPNGVFSDGSTEAGLGTNGTISVTYSSDEPSVTTPYREDFDVMVENSGNWPVPAAGPDGSNLHGNLKTFYSLAQVIARHVGELGR